MDNFNHLLVPQPGWTRQATSFGRDPDRGDDWGGYRHLEARVKRILLAPGETHTMEGNLADLYAAYRLDGAAITEAVAELLLAQ